MALIYHLLPHSAWQQALDGSSYRSPSLDTEGFIHCSTREQVLESADKHFGEHDELVCLEIVDRRVKEILKWEPGRNEELFPHLYGPLPLTAVEQTHFLIRASNGKFDWDV